MTLTHNTDTEPIDDMIFQDAMEMASNDDQDDDMEGSSSLALTNVSIPFPTLEVFTDKRQDQNGILRLDGYDNDELEVDEDDDDKTSDYDDATVGKKRKRVRIEASDTDLNHSKVTDARIKAEGGESFILDEDTNPLAHHQSSRVFGTFGHRKSGPPSPTFNMLTTSR